MSGKRFHSRRSHRRAFPLSGICMFVGVAGLVAINFIGSMALVTIAAAVGAVVLAWIAVRGRKDIIEYVLGTALAPTPWHRRGAIALGPGD